MIYKLKCRIKFHAIQLGPERGATELCQGAAEWASKVLKRKLAFKDLARRAATTKAANSGLPLPETSKYFKVRSNTMMVYHQASRDTAHKVAGILSGHAPASKPAGPGLLDEDFLLESTLLGIPENNAEVVAAVVASPAQDVPHVPKQVAPIAPVDVPHVPKQVAPIAPVDVPPCIWFTIPLMSSWAVASILLSRGMQTMTKPIQIGEPARK